MTRKLLNRMASLFRDPWSARVDLLAAAAFLTAVALLHAITR